MDLSYDLPLYMCKLIRGLLSYHRSSLMLCHIMTSYYNTRHRIVSYYIISNQTIPQYITSHRLPLSLHSIVSRSQLFADPDLITDGTVAMSCSLSLFIIPATVPTGLTACRKYLDLLLKRMRRNQTSIRRLFSTSTSSSTSSSYSTSFSSPSSFSASASTCYSPLTFSPVPISIEKDELNDNFTPFNSCALEESNKLGVEDVVKKEKKKQEVEMIRCNDENDTVSTSDHFDENVEYDDRTDENQDEERCNKHKYYSVHKQLGHNVNKNNLNTNSDEDVDVDDVKNSSDSKYGSKNKSEDTSESEYRKEIKNGYKHKRKDKGQDKRREGTIMEWSAIGSLNWDIMFLLGGGFALSEGFQVR
jgi:hypothetical protein